MIKAENITKVYNGAEGENIVLDNLCFCADKGEFCIITGKSGCGKSTLLNILSSLDNFDEGKLVIDGKDIKTLPQKNIYEIRKKDISFIFQGYNLISSMTATENVSLALKYQGIPKQKRLAIALNSLCEVGLSHRYDYLPHQMSGGQQQRVAIARALATKPKILFCDEPTGNLDKESATLVLQKIKQLQKGGTLVIMITHDNSLLPLADKQFVLQNGKLV